MAILERRSFLFGLAGAIVTLSCSPGLLCEIVPGNLATLDVKFTIVSIHVSDDQLSFKKYLHVLAVNNADPDDGLSAAMTIDHEANLKSALEQCRVELQKVFNGRKKHEQVSCLYQQA